MPSRHRGDKLGHAHLPVQLRSSGALAARWGSQNTDSLPSGGEGSSQGSLKQGRESLESGRSASPPAAEQVPGKPTRADPGLISDLARSRLHPACSSSLSEGFTPNSNRAVAPAGGAAYVGTEPPGWERPLLHLTPGALRSQ